MTAPLNPAQRERAMWQRLEHEQTRRNRNGKGTTQPQRKDYTPARYTHDRLLDLIAWRTDLQRLADHATDPSTPQPHATTTDTSPIEAIANQRTVITRIYTDLDALAEEAARTLGAWPIKGDPLTWLSITWNRIAKTTLAPPAASLIKTLHATAARLEGYGPEYADHKCPHCVIRQEKHIPRLERHATNHGLPLLYTCPTCGYAAIIDPAGWWNHNQPTNTLEHTWRARLAEVDAWLTPKDTALILDIPYSTIRTWIHRGTLERNTAGEINLKQTAQQKKSSASS